MERLAYSIREAAALIGVSARTVAREIKRGHLTAVRIGRSVRVPRDALATLLSPSRPLEQIETETEEQSDVIH